MQQSLQATQEFRRVYFELSAMRSECFTGQSLDALTAIRSSNFGTDSIRAGVAKVSAALLGLTSKKAVERFVLAATVPPSSGSYTIPQFAIVVPLAATESHNYDIGRPMMVLRSSDRSGVDVNGNSGTHLDYLDTSNRPATDLEVSDFFTSINALACSSLMFLVADDLRLQIVEASSPEFQPAVDWVAGESPAEKTAQFHHHHSPQGTEP